MAFAKAIVADAIVGKPQNLIQFNSSSQNYSTICGKRSRSAALALSGRFYREDWFIRIRSCYQVLLITLSLKEIITLKKLGLY